MAQVKTGGALNGVGDRIGAVLAQQQSLATMNAEILNFIDPLRADFDRLQRSLHEHENLSKVLTNSLADADPNRATVTKGNLHALASEFLVEILKEMRGRLDGAEDGEVNFGFVVGLFNEAFAFLGAPQRVQNRLVEQVNELNGSFQSVLRRLREQSQQNLQPPTPKSMQETPNQTPQQTPVKERENDVLGRAATEPTIHKKPPSREKPGEKKGLFGGIKNLLGAKKAEPEGNFTPMNLGVSGKPKWDPVKKRYVFEGEEEKQEEDFSGPPPKPNFKDSDEKSLQLNSSHVSAVEKSFESSSTINDLLAPPNRMMHMKKKAADSGKRGAVQPIKGFKPIAPLTPIQPIMERSTEDMLAHSTLKVDNLQKEIIEGLKVGVDARKVIRDFEQSYAAAQLRAAKQFEICLGKFFDSLSSTCYDVNAIYWKSDAALTKLLGVLLSGISNASTLHETTSARVSFLKEVLERQRKLLSASKPQRNSAAVLYFGENEHVLLDYQKRVDLERIYFENQSEFYELRLNYIKLREETSKYDTQIAQLEGKLASAGLRSEVLEEDLKQRRESAKYVKSLHDEGYNALKRSHDDLQTIVDAQTKLIQRLQSDVSHAQNAERKALERRRADEEHAKQLQKMLDDLSKQVRSLESTLTSRDSEINHLRTVAKQDQERIEQEFVERLKDLEEELGEAEQKQRNDGAYLKLLEKEQKSLLGKFQFLQGENKKMSEEIHSIKLVTKSQVPDRAKSIFKNEPQIAELVDSYFCKEVPLDSAYRFLFDK